MLGRLFINIITAISRCRALGQGSYLQSPHMDLGLGIRPQSLLFGCRAPTTEGFVSTREVGKLRRALRDKDFRSLVGIQDIARGLRFRAWGLGLGCTKNIAVHASPSCGVAVIGRLVVININSCFAAGWNIFLNFYVYLGPV